MKTIKPCFTDNSDNTSTKFMKNISLFIAERRKNKFSYILLLAFFQMKDITTKNVTEF